MDGQGECWYVVDGVEDVEVVGCRSGRRLSGRKAGRAREERDARGGPGQRGIKGGSTEPFCIWVRQHKESGDIRRFQLTISKLSTRDSLHLSSGWSQSNSNSTTAQDDPAFTAELGSYRSKGQTSLSATLIFRNSRLSCPDLKAEVVLTCVGPDSESPWQPSAP